MKECYKTGDVILLGAKQDFLLTVICIKTLRQNWISCHAKMHLKNKKKDLSEFALMMVTQ